MSSTKISKKVVSRQIFLVVIVILVAIILIPQFKSFSGSIDNIKNVNIAHAYFAVLFTVGSYFAAAGTYYFLAIKKLQYPRTVIVQFAAMFINRLLPSGIGALGLSFGYLKKFKHTNIQSAAIVGLNNFLGFIGNSLIILIVLAVTGISVPKSAPLQAHLLYLLIFLPGIVLLTYLVINKKRRTRLLKSLKDIKKQFSLYTHNPHKPLLALSSSCLLAACNFISLFICVHAVGGTASLAVIVVVYSFGIGVGSSVPTPGGLGGVEAGMVAGFVAFGVPASVALSAVLLYRLISFWLMLIPGAISFAYVQNKGLIQFRNKR